MSTSPGETTPDAPAPLPISPRPATGPGENTTPAAGTQQDTSALSAADQDAVAAAEKKAARKATKAAQKAAVEREKRKKALVHQNAVLLASGTQYDPRNESTPPERKPFINVDAPALRVGEHVHVDDALSMIGPARYGGDGYVVSTTGYGAATKLTVRYTSTDARSRKS